MDVLLTELQCSGQRYELGFLRSLVLIPQGAVLFFQQSVSLEMSNNIGYSTDTVGRRLPPIAEAQDQIPNQPTG